MALTATAPRSRRLPRSVRKQQVRRPLTKRQRRRRRLRRVLVVALVFVLAVLLGIGTFISGLLAAPISLAVPPPPTSVLLLSDDGRQFASIPPPEQREIVRPQDIPDVMKQAIVSAEDERFFQHKGVDPLATVRAAFRDLTGGNTQGGSTLTQQYVKNVYVGNERTGARKIKEAALAVRLEQKLSKDQIVTDYLNVIFLGNGVYGVQAASKYYFGVPITQLGYDPVKRTTSPLLALARASILAGIAPAPTAWNPVADYGIARQRQQYTLNRMVVGGYITPQQATTAFHLPVSPVKQTPAAQPGCDEPGASQVGCTQAPEFADFVTYQLRKKYSADEDAFFRGGLRVTTTLDLDLQEAMDQALREVLPKSTDPQAAIVAVDYRNGDIKAMGTLRRAPALVLNSTGKVVRAAVDGYDRRIGFNLASNALRSTGSTIKPFTYATALMNGYTPETTEYGGGSATIACHGCKPDPYVVHNSEPSEAGTFTLRRALAQSVNTVYVPLAIKVGRAKVAQLAVKAGLTSDVLKETGSLSFGIGGGVEVTPLSEAVAYSTFANGGVHVGTRSYTAIRSGATATKPGSVVSRTPTSSRARVVTPVVAGQVVDALGDVVTSGTAARSGLPDGVFGKTGTTNDSTDAWFTGCMPSLNMCLASWMGNEYQTCTTTVKVGAKSEPAHVAGACGGMHDLEGVKGQIFGGTLPAKVFATALKDYQQIKAQRASAKAGLPATSVAPLTTPTPSPTAYRRRRRYSTAAPSASSRPTAVATRSTPRPTTRPAPAPTAARPVLPIGGSPSP